MNFVQIYGLWYDALITNIRYDININYELFDVGENLNPNLLVVPIWMQYVHTAVHCRSIVTACTVLPPTLTSWLKTISWVLAIVQDRCEMLVIWEIESDIYNFHQIEQFKSNDQAYLTCSELVTLKM